MARDDTIVVRGYRELMAACAEAPKELRKEVRSILREAGEAVRRDATSRFEAYSSVSAHGYRTVARTRGITVDQRLRKVTGRHPEWGALQMRRALLPALHENTERFERDMEHAVELIRDVFEYQAY